MIDSNANYAFVDIDEQEQVIHGHEVIDRNGWIGVTTYYRFNSVTYDGDDFICLATNSNVIPGTNPTIWSYLVALEGESTPVSSAGSDYVARSLGSLAYETALEAYALAINGTNLIYVEAGTRSEADQYLQNLIVAETGSRITGQDAIIAFVFGSIAVDLTNETGSRIAADIFEQGTRSEADQYLQNLIVTETGSRVAGEQAIIAFVFGSIAVDLVAETGSRIAADNYEAGTRSEADQYLQNQITTAQAAIVTEQGTRSSADQVLQTQVTTQSGVNVSQQAQLDSLFAALGVSFSGTFAWWMSQIHGGMTDTKLNVVNGIVSGVTESTFSWEDFEFYGTGSISSGSFNLGTSWNGAGITTVSPIPGAIAEEYYNSLADGPISLIPTSTGTGWAAAGTVGGETTIGYYGSDAFSTYSTGTVIAGEIDAGFNWSGTATIYAR